MGANYKQKYLDIRSKLVESTDVAYRMGFEDGLKEGEMQAMQQQMQQQAEMQAMQQQAEMQAMQQGGEVAPEDGMPIEGEAMPEEELSPEEIEMMEEENAAGGSELDQSIAELENLVSKGEKPKVTDLRKAVETICTIRKSQKEKLEKRNKKIQSAQKQFVDNMLKSWENEAKESSTKLEDVIREHGITVD